MKKQTFFFLFLLAAILSGCATTDSKNGVIGTWYGEDYISVNEAFTMKMVMHFNEDNTFLITSIPSLSENVKKQLKDKGFSSNDIKQMFAKTGVYIDEENKSFAGTFTFDEENGEGEMFMENSFDATNDAWVELQTPKSILFKVEDGKLILENEGVFTKK